MTDRFADSNRRESLGLRVTCAIAIAAMLALWIVHANVPFCRKAGFGDWIGGRIGVMADNYLRYGLAETKGAMILNVDPVADAAERVLYRGHPATVPLLTAAVFATTGSRAPWAHRVAPFLATLASVLLVWLLARRDEPRAVWTVLLFLACPVLSWHGGTPSYEPFCLPVMLAILLAYERGWRNRLAPCLLLGGLIDFPVLYLIPVLLVVEWRRRGNVRSLVTFAAAISAAGFAAIGLHFVHLSWSGGTLTGQWQESLQAKILRSVFDADVAPPLTVLAQSQWAHAKLCFSWLPIGACVLGALWCWRSIGLYGWAFAFSGTMHAVLFRSHAFKHDFWLWYLLPFVAIASAHFVVRLPRLLAWIFVAGALWLGGATSLDVWRERAAPPVAAVVEDLRSELARARTSPKPALHQARGPESFALDVELDSPVFDLADWLTQAAQARSFRDYLDSVALFGGLNRRHLAYMFEPGMRNADQKVMASFFPAARERVVQGTAGRYRFYDVTGYLMDPSQSITLRRLLGEAECRRHLWRARLHIVLPSFPVGTELLWLTGVPRRVENLRGRIVRTGGPAELRTVGAGWTIAGWPGTTGARLVATWGRQVGRKDVDAHGKRVAIPFFVK